MEQSVLLSAKEELDKVSSAKDFLWKKTHDNFVLIDPDNIEETKRLIPILKDLWKLKSGNISIHKVNGCFYKFNSLYKDL